MHVSGIKAEIWVRDRNLGLSSLYVIFQVLRPDKITTEVSINGEEK